MNVIYPRAGAPAIAPIATHELRVPIDPVQGGRHDVLLGRVDRPGEGLRPVGHRSRLGWRPEVGGVALRAPRAGA